MNRLATAEVHTRKRRATVGTRDQREHTGIGHIRNEGRRYVVGTELGKISLRFFVVEDVFAGIARGKESEEERIVRFFEGSAFVSRTAHVRFEVKHTLRAEVTLIAQAIEFLRVYFNGGQLFHLRVELLISLSRRSRVVSGSSGICGSSSGSGVLTNILTGSDRGNALRNHLRAKIVGHRPVVVSRISVDAVRDLIDRIVLVNDRVTTLSGRAEGFFFIEEAERVVVLPRHGRVSRTDARSLVRTFPVVREVSRRIEVRCSSEGFVVDTHVRAAAGTEGHRLQSEVKFLAGGALLHRHNHHFAVASVARSLLQRRESHAAPFAFTGLHIGETIDVVETTTLLTRADQDRAVGQFFCLGFVGTFGHSGDRSLAEHLPCLTEVVGIEHPVGEHVGASEHHGIETIMRTHLHTVALYDATATEEESFHLAAGRLVRAVEERVDLLGDVFRLRPCRSVVVRIPASHSDGRVARRTVETHLSRSTEQDHLVAFAVGHDRRVTITGIATVVGAHVVVLTDTLRHGVAACVTKYIGGRPRGTVIRGAREEEVDAACADIAHSRMARVRHSQYRTVLRRRDGRDTISHLRRVVVHEDIFLRFGFSDRTRHRHVEISEQSRVVRTAEGELRRGRVVVARPAHVLRRLSRGEALVTGCHREVLAGLGALGVEFEAADRIARTGRQRVVAGQHLIAHIGPEVIVLRQHVVGHRREAHLGRRLRRRPSVFVGARTLRSHRTLVDAHLHTLHGKEHLQAAAVVLTARPEREARIAVVHLVQGLSRGIHVNGRFVRTKIGAHFEFPIRVVSRSVRHIAERHERTAAGLTFHRLGRGEHLRRSGGLIVNAIAGFRRTDETPKILVVEFCGGAHELDRAVVSGVADVETIGRDLQRVPASAGGKLSALDCRGLKRRCEHIGREGSRSAQPESQRKK